MLNNNLKYHSYFKFKKGVVLAYILCLENLIKFY